MSHVLALAIATVGSLGLGVVFLHYSSSGKLGEWCISLIMGILARVGEGVRGFGCARQKLHTLARTLQDRVDWSEIATDRTTAWSALACATVMRQRKTELPTILHLGLGAEDWRKAGGTILAHPLYERYTELAYDLVAEQETLRELRELASETL